MASAPRKKRGEKSIGQPVEGKEKGVLRRPCRRKGGGRGGGDRDSKKGEGNGSAFACTYGAKGSD